MIPKTRKEHIVWAKERALHELDAPGQTDEQAMANGFASMVSDLNKHPETNDHPANSLGMQLMLAGRISTRAEMRQWIKDYN